MALMFQRLARNYIKNGYFPTDADTTQRVLNAIAPSSGAMRIIDPCCGEGVALAECQHHLGSEAAMSYGIEFDEERAYQAKQLLQHCIHGDLQNCVVGPRQFGLLWLNPPYGDLLNDSDGMFSTLNWKGRKRLEKLFYYRTHPYLQFGGVMVLIIPHYSLDKELSQWIARQFTQVRVFLAPEQRFKQVVIFGIRRRALEAVDTANVRDQLIAVGAGELPPVLPEDWPDEPYVVPASSDDLNAIKFKAIQVDAKQLQDVWRQHPGLWDRFDLTFSRFAQRQRRPLKQLSTWHLSLALAAGQVAGVVKSQDGRTFVIKGDTHKEKEHRVESTTDSDGNITTTQIATDKFVPVIRAIDFTPGLQFGQVLEIR